MFKKLLFIFILILSLITSLKLPAQTRSLLKDPMDLAPLGKMEATAIGKNIDQVFILERAREIIQMEDNISGDLATCDEDSLKENEYFNLQIKVNQFCGICEIPFDENHSILKNTCGHCYCGNCLKQYSFYRSECPVCDASLVGVKNLWIKKKFNPAKDLEMDDKYKGENERVLEINRAYYYRMNNLRGNLNTPIKYLNLEERKKYQVQIKNQIISDGEGKPWNTSKGKSAMIVISKDGNTYISDNYLLRHSSLVAGEKVKYAGLIKIKKGVITSINNFSGHYKPRFDNLFNGIIILMRKGASFHKKFFVSFKE